MKYKMDKSFKMPVLKFRGKSQHIKYPCLASLKYNGEMEYLIVKNTKALLINKPKYGRIRIECPITEIARRRLPDGIYLGELIYKDGRTYKDFYGLLRNKCSDNLKLRLWNIILLENKDYSNESPFKIFEILNQIDPQTEYLSVVPNWIIENEKNLLILKNRIFSEGWEGLVVRNPNSKYWDGSSIDWIKIKNYGDKPIPKGAKIE